MLTFDSNFERSNSTVRKRTRKILTSNQGVMSSKKLRKRDTWESIKMSLLRRSLKLKQKEHADADSISTEKDSNCPTTGKIKLVIFSRFLWQNFYRLLSKRRPNTGLELTSMAFPY